MEFSVLYISGNIPSIQACLNFTLLCGLLIIQLLLCACHSHFPAHSIKCGLTTLHIWPSTLFTLRLPKPLKFLETIQNTNSSYLCIISISLLALFSGCSPRQSPWLLNIVPFNICFYIILEPSILSPFPSLCLKTSLLCQCSYLSLERTPNRHLLSPPALPQTQLCVEINKLLRQYDVKAAPSSVGAKGLEMERKHFQVKRLFSSAKADSLSEVILGRAKSICVWNNKDSQRTFTKQCES